MSFMGLLLDVIIGKPNDNASKTIKGRFSQDEANKKRDVSL